MPSSNTTLSVYENELIRVHQLTQGLMQFFRLFESDNFEDEKDGLDAVLFDVAKAVNPKLTDDEAADAAQIPICSFAAGIATVVTGQLAAAMTIHRGCGDGDSRGTADDLLLNTADGKVLDRDKFLESLPWLLDCALQQLMCDGWYAKNIATEQAAGVRILAATIERMRGLGFSIDEPEGV